MLAGIQANFWLFSYWPVFANTIHVFYCLFFFAWSGYTYSEITGQYVTGKVFFFNNKIGILAYSILAVIAMLLAMPGPGEHAKHQYQTLTCNPGPQPQASVLTTRLYCLFFGIANIKITTITRPPAGLCYSYQRSRATLITIFYNKHIFSPHFVIGY